MKNDEPIDFRGNPVDVAIAAGVIDPEGPNVDELRAHCDELIMDEVATRPRRRILSISAK